MNLIRNLPEPKRLLLAWQSSRPGSSRRRWEVGELTRENIQPDAPVTFRYFSEEKLAGPLEEGFDGYPAFRLKQESSEDALETFMRRLPPRRRADFSRYLENLRIDPSAEFTDFALLAASEAKLPSDGFSVVNPLDDAEGPLQILIEAVGHRHLPHSPIPFEGQIATLDFEPSNEHDSNAIAIKVDGLKIGWINRLQTAAFRRWMVDGRVSLVVARVNGADDYPRVYLMASVREPVPA